VRQEHAPLILQLVLLQKALLRYFPELSSSASIFGCLETLLCWARPLGAGPVASLSWAKRDKGQLRGGAAAVFVGAVVTPAEEAAQHRPDD